jgi:hypothetical protein
VRTALNLDRRPTPTDTADWRMVKQIALDTGYSVSTVHKWIRTGRVVSGKMGGRVWVDAG